MKYLTQYMTMLKVCELVSQMPRGEGWTVARDFTQWTGLSRATVYRYLANLVKHGVLKKRETKVGKRVYREYKMTAAGAELYASQKRLFKWD